MAGLPWFKFYAQEYLADGRVTSWSLEECGAFIRMLAHCWTDGSIPNDMQSMARLLHVDSPAMRGIWSAIGDRFIPHPDMPGRLTSPRLENEREAAEKVSEKRSEAGKKGATTRWDKEKAKHSKRMRLPSASHEVAIPVASDCHTDTEADLEPDTEAEIPRSNVSRLPAQGRARATLGPLGTDLVARVESGLGHGLAPLRSQDQAEELEAACWSRGGRDEAYQFIAATYRQRNTEPKSVAWLLAVLKDQSAGGVQ